MAGSPSLRPVWSMCGVLGQPGIHTETLPTIFFTSLFFNYGYLCGYVRGLARRPEVSDPPGDGVAGTCKPSSMGAGT